jgi:hypothetical protein
VSCSYSTRKTNRLNGPPDVAAVRPGKRPRAEGGWGECAGSAPDEKGGQTIGEALEGRGEAERAHLERTGTAEACAAVCKKNLQKNFYQVQLSAKRELSSATQQGGVTLRLPNLGAAICWWRLRAG